MVEWWIQYEDVFVIGTCKDLVSTEFLFMSVYRATHFTDGICIMMITCIFDNILFFNKIIENKM